MTLDYKGFMIDILEQDCWAAIITNRRTGKVWCKGPRTSLEGGAGPCAQTAKNLIDAYIARRGSDGLY